MLYKVRYDIAQSELMETGISSLQTELLFQFRKYEDKEHPGTISVAQAEQARLKIKTLSLTPFQLHCLLGLSDCDGQGMIDYVPFAKIAVEYVESELKFETLVKKS